MEWWQKGVFYQIYPRSFRDSNGDGVGDIKGVTKSLDHLEWLGIDGVWLNPIYPSPNDDWGYDVSDYTGVHPELGTMEDVEELIAEAAARGIKILMDFVPNHISSAHPWFVAARSSKGSRYRDWFVWADPKPDGSPPNNWVSLFGGSAWELDEVSGQYYLHNFLESQADLNWWNDEVRDAMDDVLRFWFDKGVAGFRIDVVHAVIKDKNLRDNLPVARSDHPEVTNLGQQLTYSMNRPEVHGVIRGWRKLAHTYDPPRILIGEAYALDLARLATFYGRGDELDFAFNFPVIFAAFEAPTMPSMVDFTFDQLPAHAWPVWAGSNHDVLRFPTRWCGGDERKIRVALMMLLTLRGTPFLYYGDEIGMTNVDVPHEQMKDPIALRFHPENPGRDAARTPMQWSGDEGAGFTEPGVTPWLPFGDHDRINVADQKVARGSILHLARGLISLRKKTEDLRSGTQVTIPAPDGSFAYARGAATLVVLNMDDAPRTIEIDGDVLLTSSGRDLSAGPLNLEGWEGAILARRKPVLPEM